MRKWESSIVANLLEVDLGEGRLHASRTKRQKADFDELDSFRRLQWKRIVESFPGDIYYAVRYENKQPSGVHCCFFIGDRKSGGRNCRIAANGNDREAKTTHGYWRLLSHFEHWDILRELGTEQPAHPCPYHRPGFHHGRCDARKQSQIHRSRHLQE